MKEINFIICLALAIVIFLSCGDNKTIAEHGGIPTKEGVTVVTASVDNNGTKTTLNNTNVFWSAGDAFAAFPKSIGVAALKFDLDGVGGASTGAFTAVGTFDVGQRYAFYPHAVGITLATDVVSFVLPQTQSYVANSFGNGANPAVATSTDNSFAFKNLCGVLQIKLTGNGAIKSIDITSDKKISGAATATFGITPVITMTGAEDADKTVTLDCGNGVKLHATTETSFYVVLPPVPHQLVVKINRTDGKIKEINGSVEISRNEIKPMKSIDVALGFTSSGATYLEDRRRVLNPDIGFHQHVFFQIEDNNLTTPFITGGFLAETVKDFDLLHFRIGLEAFSANMGGVSKELTATVLTRLDNTFNLVRDYGLTVIIRFSYDMMGVSHGKGYDCEPPMSVMERQIAQIGEVVNRHLDVISGVETGMFGPWGEQHSTSFCGTPASLQSLVEAWLNSVDEIGVTVRTPSHYRSWLNLKYGLSYDQNNMSSLDIDTNSNIVSGEKARAKRVGCYNDGLSGSATDWGTFSNRAEEIKWLNKAGRHTLYGGECIVDDVTNGMGQYNTVSYLEVESFLTRLSYLNRNWNLEYVISTWEKQLYNGVDMHYKNSGLTEFQFMGNRMGYRIFLSSTQVDQEVDITTNQKLNIQGALKNVGFANVVNRKKVQIVLHNGESTYYFDTNLDIRQLEPKGEMNYSLEIDLSKVINMGEYGVYMKISSVHEKSISNNRTIEFANYTNLWNNEIGSNQLGAVRVTDFNGEKLDNNSTEGFEYDF